MAFDQVRVRLAPSPTGDPHVGTGYIALFNYVFARKNKGKLILRIEDTDQVRSRASSEQMIMESLRWLGLDWDEGPDVGGSYGPYRQSERRHLHQEHAHKLVTTGHAYRCFCTTERLDEMRAKQKEDGDQLGYDRHCRNLPEATIKSNLAANKPFVVRMKMPTDGVTVVKDLLRGNVEFENQRIDDQVLLKSDGYPTYHLANVVDDHLMKVSHVIRAEEWISSTPKHVLLYEAFGWEKPTFVHMPLLRNTDKSKISKRKNPVSLRYYQRAGILPEAMVNFLALMGWSFGNDIEIFTINDMIEKFELERINLGGPIFDQTKLNWMNNQYMQKISAGRFVEFLRDQVFNIDQLLKIKPFAVERMDRFDQFLDNNMFFFNGALKYDGIPLVPAGKTNEDMITMLGRLAETLDEVYDWSIEPIKQAMDAVKTELNWKPKDYFMPVRLVVTGRKDSPPLVESIEIIGREMTRFRIRDAADYLKAHPQKNPS
jgi:glutamyl-tRNA synthetase